jgi:hypothetical protein
MNNTSVLWRLSGYFERSILTISEALEPHGEIFQPHGSVLDGKAFDANELLMKELAMTVR